MTTIKKVAKTSLRDSAKTESTIKDMVKFFKDHPRANKPSKYSGKEAREHQILVTKRKYNGTIKPDTPAKEVAVLASTGKTREEVAISLKRSHSMLGKPKEVQSVFLGKYKKFLDRHFKGENGFTKGAYGKERISQYVFQRAPFKLPSSLTQEIDEMLVAQGAIVTDSGKLVSYKIARDAIDRGVFKSGASYAPVDSGIIFTEDRYNALLLTGKFNWIGSDLVYTPLGLGGMPKKKLMLMPISQNNNKKKKNKKSSKKRVIVPRGQTPASVNQMVRAIINPFNGGAAGCRICDRMTAPTTTYIVRGAISTQAPSGTTAGSCMMFPHPHLTWLDFSGGGFNAAAFTVSVAGVRYSVNNGFYGACAPIAIQNIMNTYRVVACGFKVRVQMSEQFRTGSIVFAPVFYTRGGTPGYNALNDTLVNPSSGMATKLLGGLNPTVFNSAAILALPGAFEISLNDLTQKDLLLNCKPSSPAYEMFHTSTADSTLNNLVTDGTQLEAGTVSGLIIHADDVDLLDMSGLNGWAMHFQGVPNATVPLVEIEYIMHLEGTPAISNSTSATPTPSGMPSSTASFADFQRALDTVVRSPGYRMVAAGASNIAFQGVANALGVPTGMTRSMRRLALN